MPTKKTVRTGKKKEFELMTVKQVMQKQVQSAHLKTKGDVIASLMIEGFGAVLVVDAKDKFLGIVSEHDLLAAMDDGHKLGAVAASEIMTFNPYSIHLEVMLPTLVHVFRASDLIRVPVVDAKDILVGIIARCFACLSGRASKMLKMTPFSPPYPGAPRRAFPRASFSVARLLATYPSVIELSWQLGVGRKGMRFSHRAPCGLAGMSF
jgi:CBS domain-containing protein